MQKLDKIQDVKVSRSTNRDRSKIKTTYNNAVNYIATGKPELEVQGQGAVLQEKKRSSKAY